MLQEILEQLFEFAAKSIPSEQILEAKKSYQKETGEIYEDDQSYNTRMALFLEWYLFDNYIDDSSTTILDSLLQENPEDWDADQIEKYKKIKETFQALYLVKKVKDDSVKVLNLFTDEIFLVQDKDSKLIFRKNDIFQGRIVLFEDQYYFTGNFCFHPEKTHRFIKPEIKNVSKILIQHKKDLAKLEKVIFKANKVLNNLESKIESFETKISQSESEGKTERLQQKLAVLVEDKEKQVKQIQDLETKAFVIKNDKIKIEGNKQINALINRFAYMNLKWERSRQIEISDIYKN
ncbi:MAG: hypothetical protein VW455_05505 [Nitrospinota bacterium]